MYFVRGVLFIVTIYLLRVPILKTDTGHFSNPKLHVQLGYRFKVHVITVKVTATVTTQIYVNFSRRIGILSLVFAVLSVAA